MSDTVYRRCCGMDIHKDTIVVCVLAPDGQTGPGVQKSYGTFRNDLTRMRGWLKMLKVTEIAMESTGVYWRPVWNVLEGHVARRREWARRESGAGQGPARAQERPAGRAAHRRVSAR